jgi:hypothetical protein
LATRRCGKALRREISPPPRDRQEGPCHRGTTARRAPGARHRPRRKSLRGRAKRMRFTLKQESALRVHVRRPGVMGARCFTKRNEINGVGRDGAHVQYHSPWPVRFPSPDREIDASPHSIGKRRVGSA